MNAESEVNITLSGWSGVGTSTLTLHLAKLLKREYVYIGSLFRELGSRLGYGEEGMDRPAVDAYLEPIIGKTVDKYVDQILVEGKNLVLESDLSAFRIGRHPKVYSIFLKASMDARVARVAFDSRDGGAEALEERDRVLREKYIELWNIDIFDEELINDKYRLVLDTSSLSIEEKIYVVLDELRAWPGIGEHYDWDEIRTHVKEEVELYLELRSKGYRDTLYDLGLVISPDRMMAEMRRMFPEDVEAYPNKVKTFFVEAKED